MDTPPCAAAMPMYSLYAMPTNTPQLAASPLLGRDGWCSDAVAAGAALAGAPPMPDARGLWVCRCKAAAPQITSCVCHKQNSDYQLPCTRTADISSELGLLWLIPYTLRLSFVANDQWKL